MIEIVTPTQTKRLDGEHADVCAHICAVETGIHTPQTTALASSVLHLNYICANAAIYARKNHSVPSVLTAMNARAHSVNWKTLRLVRAHRITLISRGARARHEAREHPTHTQTESTYCGALAVRTLAKKNSCKAYKCDV